MRIRLTIYHLGASAVPGNTKPEVIKHGQSLRGPCKETGVQWFKVRYKQSGLNMFIVCLNKIIKWMSQISAAG